MMTRITIGLLLTAMAVSVFMPGTAVSAENAGKVVKIEGVVKVRRGDTAKTERLKDNSIVSVGDTVLTGRDGKVKLLMKDESIITLGRSSTVVVKSYEVEPGSGKRETLLSLVTGKIRALVKKSFSSSDSSFEVSTPTAVAGVRGTHLIVISDIQENTVIVCLDGEVTVYSIDQDAGDGMALGPEELAQVLRGELPSSLAGGMLDGYVDDTTFVQLEGMLHQLLIDAAELEDLESITAEDVQEILSWVNYDAYGERLKKPYREGTRTHSDTQQGTGFGTVPSGGTGGGGADVSPNSP